MIGVCASSSDCSQCDGPVYPPGKSAEPTFNIAIGKGTSKSWTSGTSCNFGVDDWTTVYRTDFIYQKDPLAGGSATNPSIYFADNASWEDSVNTLDLAVQAVVISIKSSDQALEQSINIINTGIDAMISAFNGAISAIGTFRDMVLSSMTNVDKFYV